MDKRNGYFPNDFYDQYPCLYQITSREFHNKVATSNALGAITETFNLNCKSSITSNDIQKKLHGITTQYATEIKEIKKSHPTDISTENVFKPKLCFFDGMGFIHEESCNNIQGESNMELPSEVIILNLLFIFQL